MSDPDFLSYEDVIDIHQRVLDRHGGAEGIVDENVIRAAIANPQWALRYDDADVTELAAAYLISLASQQGFQDGNKRTAVVAAVEFLGRNGYHLNATDLEVYDVTMRVADADGPDRMTKGEVAAWLLEHLESNE
jgi:death on curing protein